MKKTREVKKEVVKSTKTLQTITCDVCKRVSQEHVWWKSPKEFFEFEFHGYHDYRDGHVDIDYIHCCSDKDCVKKTIKEWTEIESNKDDDNRKLEIKSGLLKIIASIIDNK